MTHQALGGFQQLVLLAALRLDQQAYGARIQREIEETAGRSVTLSTLYITMERLEKTLSEVERGRARQDS